MVTRDKAASLGVLRLLLLLSVVVLLVLLRLHLDGLLHDLHGAAARRVAVRVHLLRRRVRDDRVHQLLVVPPQFRLLLLLELGLVDIGIRLGICFKRGYFQLFHKAPNRSYQIPA